MVKYFCDRCKVELSSSNDNSTTPPSARQIFLSAGGLKKLLCEKCWTDWLGLAKKFFEGAD